MTTRELIETFLEYAQNLTPDHTIEQVKEFLPLFLEYHHNAYQEVVHILRENNSAEYNTGKESTIPITL